MKYQYTTLNEELSIKRIVSLHYFEYTSDFSFPGESHDFWEFLYVDKGEVGIVSDHETFLLKSGDIIFHKPNEFHSVEANGIIAPNLAVIGFECRDPFMLFFEYKILSLGESERYLLAQIISEARDNFCSVLNDPFLELLVRKEHPPFGCEHMIKIHLEQLLIQLFRRYSPHHQLQVASFEFSKNDELYNSIITYFELNLSSPMTIERICKDNLIGNSLLKKIFQSRHNCGVIEYFTLMKIEAAKQLIRNRQMNFTQIADYLGYTSIHYFSRQFKKGTGMTPTEYLHSIKLLSEQPL